MRPLNVNARRHVLSLCSPAFQLPGPGDVDWLVVDLKDRKDTELLPLFPVCNAFMLQCRRPRHVLLVAAVFNASSALLAAFVMAANRESYAAAAECIGSAAPKAVPHASHFVEQLELSAPKSPLPLPPPLHR